MSVRPLLCFGSWSFLPSVREGLVTVVGSVRFLDVWREGCAWWVGAGGGVVGGDRGELCCDGEGGGTARATCVAGRSLPHFRKDECEGVGLGFRR